MLVSTIIGLILLELLVRVVAPQRLDSMYPVFEADKDLVFKLKKNLRMTYSQYEFAVEVTTNSIGLRDREVAPKHPGVYRILGLGDSFSYANGVNLEDTYFKELENCLSVSTGRQIEVINCAVPAYSLLQEIQFLKKYGMTLDPDAVLVGFCVANDFSDSYELFDAAGKPTLLVHEKGLISTKAKEQERGIRGLTRLLRPLLATHSHLYVFIRNRISEILVRLRLRHPPPPPDFCAKEFSDDLEKGWQLDQQLLLDLAALVREHNMRLTVVVLPTIYQVYRDVWDQYVTTFKIDPRLYDPDKPQRLLREFCERYQIECVDVLPRMKLVGREQQLFYQIDSHMNPQGHRVVADTLCTFFTAKPIAPSHRIGQ